MKKLFVLLFIIQTSIIFPQEVVIKSLKTFSSKDANSIPVLSSPRDLLTIDFDVQTEFSPNINIIFKFCDKNWNPTDNLFLPTRKEHSLYSKLFLLPTTVEEAKYHYTNTFPDKDGYVAFPYSGKWKFL